MLIKNGSVFNKESGFGSADIKISAAKISNVGKIDAPDEDYIDATDCYVIPGLIDTHFHGSNGCDFCDASEESIEKIAEYELKNGITGIIPASMTLSFAELEKIFEVATNYADHHETTEDRADFLGINMEGPFLSPERIGAQNPKHLLNPDIEKTEKLIEKSNSLVKTINLAPELRGADDFIERFRGEARLSVAHTMCTYEEAKHAFELGMKQLTHTFNAMPWIQNRMPGPIIAAAENLEITAEIITDGIHVHPAMVRTLFKLFGDDRMIMISDSISATGMPDGKYQLGGLDVYVKGKKSTGESGNIAGSVCNLMDCLRTAVTEMNIPLHSAVKAASTNPSKAYGLSDRGDIKPGYRADLIILDKDLKIQKIIKNGKVLGGK